MKKYSGIILTTLGLLFILIFAGCTTKSMDGSYPSAVAWDNISYGLSSIEVTKSELGNQLGEVKRIKEPMPIENGDANNTPVGSKIFEINGIDTKEAIAIEKNGKTYKATKIGPIK